MKKRGLILNSCLFLLVIFGIGAGTLFRSHAAIFKELKGAVLSQQSPIPAVESQVLDTLPLKNLLIEFSGLMKKLLCLHMSDDKKFYKDSDMIVHLNEFSVGEASQYDGLLNSAGNLAEILSQSDIPFFICQLPERSTYADRFSALFDGETAAYIEPLKVLAENYEIPYLDCSKELQKAGLGKADIFFRTDIHYTTEAEFTVLKGLVALMEERGMVFENKGTVLDLSQYTVESYPFLGNLAQSFGGGYAGRDVFQYYIPNFATEMQLENIPEAVFKSGSFEDVCLNGQREYPNPTARLYRIVDYMQFSSPCYRIQNNLCSDRDILVIGDSLSMRAMAYLSLMCRSVTVLDPRFFGNIDYLKAELGNEFDAVILFSSVRLINGIGGYDAEIVSDTAPQAVNHENSYTIQITVENTGTNTWRSQSNIALCIWQDGTDWGYRIPLPEGTVVHPGERYTFELVDFVLPYQDQTVLGFQMLQEGVFYFGELEEAFISAIG